MYILSVFMVYFVWGRLAK